MTNSKYAKISENKTVYLCFIYVRVTNVFQADYKTDSKADKALIDIKLKKTVGQALFIYTFTFIFELVFWF